MQDQAKALSSPFLVTGQAQLGRLRSTDQKGNEHSILSTNNEQPASKRKGFNKASMNYKNNIGSSTKVCEVKTALTIGAGPTTGGPLTVPLLNPGTVSHEDPHDHTPANATGSRALVSKYDSALDARSSDYHS